MNKLEEKTVNKKSNTRQSNIELLRIVAMIMIIIFHMAMHEKAMYTGSTEKKIFSIILSGLGLIGVNIFVLITGYFQIEKEFKTSKVLKIWLQTVFYSIIIVLTCKYFNIIKVNTETLIFAFMPVTYPKYWFISSYILLYIFSPFINKFAKTLSQQEYKKFLILMTILFSITYTFMYRSAYTVGTGLGNLAWFIYVYLLAGYIRLYGIKFLNNKKIVITLIIVIFTVYEFLLVFAKFANIKYVCGIFTSINSAFVLSLAVLIFGLFKNLHIKDSKIINYFGSVTLTAYLIHENYLSRDIFWKLMSENIKISNIDVINTFLEMIITVALIFAVSAILEPIRRIIEKQIFKLRYVNNGLQKIDENYIGNKTK